MLKTECSFPAVNSSPLEFTKTLLIWNILINDKERGARTHQKCKQADDQGQHNDGASRGTMGCDVEICQ